MHAARREGVVGEDGGEGLALTELRPFRSWTFLAMSILILIIFWRSARAEWLEWREGWLQRSGASPLRGARKEDAAGGQDVLACAWSRHGQLQ